MVSSPGLWFLLAGYLVIAIFLVIQRVLRRTESARTLRRGAFDRGSTLLIGGAFGFAVVAPIIMYALGYAVSSLDLLEGFVGLIVMGSGLGLRVWATLTLGRYYTGTLMILEDHKVVSEGPYSVVRHPGYLGDILLWSGFGVISSSLVLVVLFPAMFAIVYAYRISVEERMLVRELWDGYVQYQKRTRKIIPLVY